ncbi:MAG: hypothetical protein NC192_07565, partial [Muribaculaceae bacterium]|nr:hypothetical protein [Muribaculaceae bacterium]
MLKNILNPRDCAECRICCVFDGDDIWEIPVIDGGRKKRVEERFPHLKFEPRGDGWVFAMGEPRDGLFTCPALDPQKGCTLEGDKPFDCMIWPYRVMNFGGKRVISIAALCPSMYGKPLSALCGELENGLAEKIFAFADENPDIVKPYEKGYPIL